MNENIIKSLFEKWNCALKTGDPKEVTKLYSKNAVLLPTVSNKVRRNHEEIEDYFVHFTAKKPIGQINESSIRIFGNIAINSGIYTFTLGDLSQVKARFTYVYEWDGKDWLIIEHHSSKMPES